MASSHPKRELARNERRSSHTYKLILLDEGGEPAELEADTEVGLGDDVHVCGARYNVVGIAWKRGEEYLLCTLREGVRAADEARHEKKAWWSTDWRSCGEQSRR
jgi:hypothetical protein